MLIRLHELREHDIQTIYGEDYIRREGKFEEGPQISSIRVQFQPCPVDQYRTYYSEVFFGWLKTWAQVDVPSLAQHEPSRLGWWARLGVRRSESRLHILGIPRLFI